MMAGAAWIIGGIAIDGWAHNTIRPLIDTFVTPWHAILYSGYLATSAVVLGTLARNRATAPTWRAAVPLGYGAALVGIVVFGISGLLRDMQGRSVEGVGLSEPAGQREASNSS